MGKQTGKINAEILRLAIPSILANITVPLVGMVDIAVAGHLTVNAATLIGGISIGSMLFDLLYWNFGFLRVSTGGLTAQAYGKGDRGECAKVLMRSFGLSMLIAVALIVIQWLFVQFAFLFVKCTPEVRALASKYFFIRIWAAPATLSLMALKGWFIGMQDSVSSMTVDLVVNGVNIAASIFLAMGFPGFGRWHGMGFSGIAAGTVAAQYAGLITALTFVGVKYREVLSGQRMKDIVSALKERETRHFMTMNRDLFIRSVCFIVIYIGYTMISARYSDILLASASIMMKLLMIFSYFTDGFAYAAEAMTGRFIGARDSASLKTTIRYVFVWSISIALLFTAIYWFGGVPMLRAMTSDSIVVDCCRQYLPWLIIMPPLGVIAFTWDGVYIGATASRQIRNAMIWSVAAFFIVWFAGMALLRNSDADGGANCIHLLLGAYFAHLVARSIHLTLQRHSIL